MKSRSTRIIAASAAVLLLSVVVFVCAQQRPTATPLLALSLIARHKAQPATTPFQTLVLTGTNIPVSLQRRGFNSLILTPFAISADSGGEFFGVRMGLSYHVRMCGDSNWVVSREYSLGPWSRSFSIGMVSNPQPQ